MHRFVLNILFFIIIFNTSISATPDTLKEIITTKIFAKGQATTAVRMGLESFYDNPAGLTAINGISMSASYASFFDNIYSSMGLSMGFQLTESIFIGCAVPVKYIADIPETVEVNGAAHKIGSFSDLETAGIISLALKMTQNIHLGMNVSYYYHRLYEENATNFTGDFGLIYEYDDFSFGAVVQNVGETKIAWSTGLKENQKQRYCLGAKIKTVDNISLMANAFIKDNEVITNAAGEIALLPQFNISFGINDISKMNSFRVGIELKFEGLSWNYVFSQKDDLGMVHKVSIEVGL